MALTKIVASRSGHRTTLIPFSGIVDDGSTLSLDFTTGVLDPRLTFTRLSNATFINSSGQVQWAAANLVLDTEIASAPTVPWNPFTATGGSNTLSNGVVVSASGSSGRAFYRQTLTNLAIGLQYSLAVEITAQSGGETYAQSVLPAAAGVTGSAQYYVNGSPRNFGDAIETGLVCVVWTAAATSIEIRIGVGGNGASVNKSVTWTKPRTVPGNIAQPAYFANSSTTAAYHAPRFDYDPTSIGTPRGLLIEGSANNLITYSDASTTGWTGLNVTGSNNNATSPDGTTSATLWTGSGGSSNRAYSTIFSVTSGATYTVSAWFKKPASNGSRYVKIYILSSTEAAIGWPSNGVLDLDTGTASGTGFTVTAYKDNWYRVVSTGTVTSTTSARAFIAMCTSAGALLTTTESMLAWGCQVEAGSGASSYIPTGASTGSRSADICYADNISSWYTQGIGTMLFVGRPIQSVTRNYLGFSTGTNPPRFLLYGTTATEVVLYLENSTSANLVFPSGSTTLGSVNRMAASFEQAGYSCVLNGGTVGTSTTASPAMPTSGINRMNIGMRNDQFQQFYGHVVQVKYWPYRLPNAQLQSLTT